MRALSALAGLALAAALVGCSDDGDSGKEDPAAEKTPTSQAPTSEAASDPATGASSAASETPEAEVEAAYRTYTDAFLTGDGATAYGLLSERCRKLYPLSDFAAAAEAAKEMYGPVKYDLRGVTIDDSGRAKVDAKFPVAGLDQGGGSEWIREDGGWRTDKCD